MARLQNFKVVKHFLAGRWLSTFLMKQLLLKVWRTTYWFIYICRCENWHSQEFQIRGAVLAGIRWEGRVKQGVAIYEMVSPSCCRRWVFWLTIVIFCIVGIPLTNSFLVKAKKTRLIFTEPFANPPDPCTLVLALCHFIMNVNTGPSSYNPPNL